MIQTPAHCPPIHFFQHLNKPLWHSPWTYLSGSTLHWKKFGAYSSTSMLCGKTFGAYSASSMLCGKTFGAYSASSTLCGKSFGAYSASSMLRGKTFGAYSSARMLRWKTFGACFLGLAWPDGAFCSGYRPTMAMTMPAITAKVMGMMGENQRKKSLRRAPWQQVKMKAAKLTRERNDAMMLPRKSTM